MAFFLRSLFGILILFHWIYSFFKSLTFAKEEETSVPPSHNHILNLGAVTLAREIRERKILCSEVIQTYINRIKQVNPFINAVVEDRFEAAMQEAQEVDRYLNNNPNELDELKITKPLLGVPITIKESIAVKGLSHTGGTVIRRNIKADKDAAVVEYLKEAGAIPLLVSNIPEYCSAINTYNKIHGHTYNPYNTLLTSGGSSGGEGALLGAGASVLGVGSDICGSIRIPAMFNGVFGHKPSSNITPLEGHVPFVDDDIFQTSLVIGPLTRFAEDLKPLLKVLSGSKAKRLKLDEKVDLSKLIVFHMNEFENNICVPKVDKNIKMAIQTATDYLRKECRCNISNYKFKEMTDAIEVGILNFLRMKKVPSALEDAKVKHSITMEFFKELFGKSIFSMHHIMCLLGYNLTAFCTFGLEKYVRKLKELRTAFETTLGDNGVLILPCAPTSATMPWEVFINLPYISYLAIFSALGLPATAVPVGFDSQKMPIGIQVVAAYGQDRLTLAVAQELEKCFGGWKAVP